LFLDDQFYSLWETCMDSEIPDVTNNVPIRNGNEPKVYDRDDTINITSRFIRIFGTTYALSHLVSVRPFRVKPNYLQNVLIWAFICGGAIGIPLAIILVTISRTNIGALVIPVGLVIGIVIGIVVSKPQYVVRISVSSGEVERIVMRDDRATRHIASIIVQAMMERI